MGRKMRGWLLLGVVFIVTLGCGGGGVLKKNDYTTLPNADIRIVLLDLAPIGSTKDHVVRVLETRLRRGRFEKTRYPLVLKIDAFNSATYAVAVKEEDFTILSYLESYGWAQNFFLAGYHVKAIWLFNGEGILKDVQVVRDMDGI